MGEYALVLRREMLFTSGVVMPKQAKESKRLLAIGDIHGCLEQLVDLIAIVEPTGDEQIVFLGDYIDRGPKSCGVIDFLLAFSERFPKTVFLKGNHEAMFLDFLHGRNPIPFLMNGGEKTLESYRADESLRISRAHLEFFENLRLFYETENFIFVHAGLRPSVSLEAQQEEDILWIRNDFLSSPFDWGKTVVFGHTPFGEPLWEEGRVGIDTGAVYGGRLACCDVERGTCLFSAGSKRDDH